MGTPKYNSPSYSLLEDTFANEFLDGRSPPACSATAKELIWEPRERAGLFSKWLWRNRWGIHGNKHLQMALAFT